LSQSALDADRAAVQLAESFRERQAQAGAFGLVQVVAGRLAEFLERERPISTRLRLHMQPRKAQLQRLRLRGLARRAAGRLRQHAAVLDGYQLRCRSKRGRRKPDSAACSSA
jgi:hypothetical protein